MSTNISDDLVDVLTRAHWDRIGDGVDGTLWRAPDAAVTVAVPAALTPDSFEWPGILKRVAHGLGVNIKAAQDLVVMRFTDVAELRAEGADDGESLPLSTGVTLVESAQVFVRCSSTSSRVEKLAIDGHYMRRGDELAAKARMAHTRHGSYVLPILMPLPRPERDSENRAGTLYPVADLTESDERRVTRTMAQTFAAVHSQVIEPGKAPDVDGLGNLLLAGATREAVLAIERLISADGVSSLGGRFTWAPGLVAPTFLPAEVVIPRESGALLLETADKMRNGPKTSIERLTGKIVEMRDPDDEGGTVHIQTVRRGRRCEVEVPVAPQSLADAHQWFTSHEIMLVAGKVESARGKPLRIPSPTVLSPVSATQIF